MKRIAFVMSVNPGCEAEYIRRHNPVWPEMEAELRARGVIDYSIFLNEATNQLFAYLTVENEAEWNAMAETEICRRWWQSMRHLMPSNPDASPVSSELKEVFHLERKP